MAALPHAGSVSDPAGIGDFTTELGVVLVLQCGQCRTVLGDSRGFVCSNATMDTFTVKAESITPSVRIMPDAVTSTSGPDKGTVYYAVECCQCSHGVGRFYLTTPRALDIVRDHFTFDIPHISSYEVGEVSGGRGEESDMGLLEAVRGLEGQVASLQERLDAHEGQMEMQLLKVENLLLLYNERLESLEGRGGGDGAQGGRAGLGDGERRAFPWEEGPGGVAAASQGANGAAGAGDRPSTKRARRG